MILHLPQAVQKHHISSAEESEERRPPNPIHNKPCRAQPFPRQLLAPTLQKNDQARPNCPASSLRSLTHRVARLKLRTASSRASNPQNPSSLIKIKSSYRVRHRASHLPKQPCHRLLRVTGQGAQVYGYLCSCAQNHLQGVIAFLAVSCLARCSADLSFLYFNPLPRTQSLPENMASNMAILHVDVCLPFGDGIFNRFGGQVTLKLLACLAQRAVEPEGRLAVSAMPGLIAVLV